MVYKEHEAWRDEVGLDSAVFDLGDLSEDQVELVYKMRDDHPVIPYTIVQYLEQYQPKLHLVNYHGY